MDPKAVIAAEAAKNPKFRETVSDGLELHGLLEHPGWKVLKEHFAKGSERYARQLTAQIMSGEAVDQRRIDYMRGCKEMAHAIFSRPETALADLERTALQLLERTWQEEAAQDNLESPYIQEAQ